MKISTDIEAYIYKEFNSFKDSLYANKSKEARQELSQFFTPPDLAIAMLKAYDDSNKKPFNKIKILDPTSGSGNLLVACLIAGADPHNLFGNEYEGLMVDLCRKRLNDAIDMLNADNFLGINNRPYINKWQIHQGNVLIDDCTTEELFNENYDDTILKELLKRRNGLKGGWLANPEAYEAYKLKKQRHHSTDKTAEIIEEYKEEMLAEQNIDPLNLFGGNN